MKAQKGIESYKAPAIVPYGGQTLIPFSDPPLQLQHKLMANFRNLKGKGIRPRTFEGLRPFRHPSFRPYSNPPVIKEF